MRQFILAKSVAYGNGASFDAVADGAVAFFYNRDGVPTVTTTGGEITKHAMLVLGRPANLGGPISLPIYKNNFSYVKGVYQAPTTFNATIKVPAPTKIGDYTIIVAKKGIKFNERNKWSADVHVSDTEMTAAKLAEYLTKAINGNPGSGVTATVSEDTITITASEIGQDYELIGADMLMGSDTTKVATGESGIFNVTARGSYGYGTAAYVKDLASKAVADSGVLYTYQDDVNYLYPNYPLNPLAQPDSVDKGYTIFTLRFAEPRDVKTRDEVVNQIIQVAFPTGAAAIKTFEDVCKTLSGDMTATSAASEEDLP